MVKRLLDLLSKNRQGLSFTKIVRRLKLSSKEKNLLKKRLRELEKKGLVFHLKRKYFLSSSSPTLRGKFSQSLRGFGFVRPDKGGMEDIFIPARYTDEALEGDQVEILYSKKGKKGKPEGKILRVLEKEKGALLGVFQGNRKKPVMIPVDPPLQKELTINIGKGSPPAKGTIVEVERESRRLKRVWGEADQPGIDTQVVIKKYNLLTSFSPQALQEAKHISPSISPQEKERRKDYRGWTTVTIDGEDARDFDDAVSIRKLDNGGYYLGVHIADVSHYVHPGSALDRDAYRRGNSVYFPERVIHMLPESLSTHVCSLNPQQERLTVSVLLTINSQGQVVDREFHPSLICTKERMTYKSVYKIFQGDQREMEKYHYLLPQLLQMRKLAGLLREKRVRKGSLDFDLPEPELVYKEGILHSVEPLETNEAHQLIEEFMLAANEEVASYLSQNNIPLLYRVHPPPSKKSLEGLRKMLSHFGLNLPSSKQITQKDLQATLAKIEGKPEEKFITLQMLKSLQLAYYSEKNKGHYGLAKEKYTHFTSPIRRYPDLVVHRILNKAIKQKSVKISSLASVAHHCSERERKAAEAEQDLVEWRIYRFLKEKLGEEVEGIIVDITKAGLVVELRDYFVQGTIPYAELDGDYYFKRTDKTLVGRRRGKKFELGDKVKAILASVNPLWRRMDLVLSK